MPFEDPLKHTPSESSWEHERAQVLTQLLLMKQSLADTQDMVKEIREAQKITTADYMKNVTAIQTNCTIRAAQDKRILSDLVRAQETADAARDSIPDNLDERMTALEKLAPVTRAVLWVGGALGLSVIGLIWALITGQAAISF